MANGGGSPPGGDEMGVIDAKRFRSAVAAVPCFATRPEPAASHRFEGQIDESPAATRAFGQIVCFVQEGLKGYEDSTPELLRIVFGIQQDWRAAAWVAVHSFGGESGGSAVRRFHGRDYVRGLRDVAKTAERIKTAAAAGPPATNLFVDALFERPSREAGADFCGNDLLLFFCRDRSLRLARDLGMRGLRLRRHCLWLFFEDDNAMERHGYLPPLVP